MTKPTDKPGEKREAGSRTPWSGAAPESWEEVEWPDWVPKSVIKEIERFWSPTNGRGPAEYARSANEHYNRSPAFGEQVHLQGIGQYAPFYEGRWVHAWNNIGRIVRGDGSVAVSSTCGYRRDLVQVPKAELEALRELKKAAQQHKLGCSLPRWKTEGCHRYLVTQCDLCEALARLDELRGKG